MCPSGSLLTPSFYLDIRPFPRTPLPLHVQIVTLPVPARGVSQSAPRKGWPSACSFPYEEGREPEKSASAGRKAAADRGRLGESEHPKGGRGKRSLCSYRRLRIHSTKSHQIGSGRPDGLGPRGKSWWPCPGLEILNRRPSPSSRSSPAQPGPARCRSVPAPAARLLLP